MMWFVGHGSISPDGDLLFGIAQKVGKKASPYARMFPPVLALCGTRQRHTKASLSLRTVCADDASTTAQHSALRGGHKRRFGATQLCRESIVIGAKSCMWHLELRLPRLSSRPRYFAYWMIQVRAPPRRDRSQIARELQWT